MQIAMTGLLMRGAAHEKAPLLKASNLPPSVHDRTRVANATLHMIFSAQDSAAAAKKA